MKISNLIELTPLMPEGFYGHLGVVQSVDLRLELQYTENRWRFRPTLYSGDWIYVDTPLDIPQLDVVALEWELSQWMLTFYATTKICNYGDSLIAKRIEKLFGQAVCERAVQDHRDFLEIVAVELNKLK